MCQDCAPKCPEGEHWKLLSMPCLLMPMNGQEEVLTNEKQTAECAQGSARRLPVHTSSPESEGSSAET